MITYFLLHPSCNLHFFNARKLCRLLNYPPLQVSLVQISNHFLVIMVMKFSANSTNIIFIILLSTFSFKFLVPYVHILGMTICGNITHHKYCAYLSILTITGSLGDVFMLCSNITKKIIFITASKNATYSAFELKTAMLFCA